MENYYELIGLSPSASSAQIKQRCLELGQAYRPDTHGKGSEARERFEEIERAFVTLTNPDSRATYDAMLSGNNTTIDGSHSEFKQSDQPKLTGGITLGIALAVAIFIYLVCVSFLNLSDLDQLRLASALTFPAALVPGILGYLNGRKDIVGLCALLAIGGFFGLYSAHVKYNDIELKWIEINKDRAWQDEIHRQKIDAHKSAIEYDRLRHAK